MSSVKLKTITPNTEVNIVEIARVSSPRTDKAEAPEGLLNYLIKNKHWSPFQHSYLTFEVVTSKAIAIQLLRHLSFTFQEFSQRYAKVESIEPIEFRLQAEKNRQSSTDVIGTILLKELRGETKVFIEDVWEGDGEGQKVTIDERFRWISKAGDLMRQVLEHYSEGIDLGIAKECARMILPMATSTTLYMTGSVRSWIHFLDIRDDAHSQKEAQLVARKIKALFIKELPIISKVLKYGDHAITEQQAPRN